MLYTGRQAGRKRQASSGQHPLKRVRLSCRHLCCCARVQLCLYSHTLYSFAMYSHAMYSHLLDIHAISCINRFAYTYLHLPCNIHALGMHTCNWQAACTVWRLPCATVLLYGQSLLIIGVHHTRCLFAFEPVKTHCRYDQQRHTSISPGCCCQTMSPTLCQCPRSHPYTYATGFFLRPLHRYSTMKPSSPVSASTNWAFWHLQWFSISRRSLHI